MKYELNQRDVNFIKQMVDITLKATGVQALSGTVRIMNILNSKGNPDEKDISIPDKGKDSSGKQK